MRFMRFGVFCCLVLGCTVALLTAAQPPQAEISNGQIHAKLYLPNAKTGFYRGTRFDWSGVIYSLEYKGHNYFGPWFQKSRDNVHDFVYEGSDIVAGPASAVTGPAEEFFTDGKALGYDEAAPGGLFIKIGVGVLRKPDGKPYDHYTSYEVVDPGEWTVKTHPDSVDFTQVLKGTNGYSYIYKKTVRLAKGKPEMLLAHSLKNTGTRAITASAYDHNFLVLDQKPAGPGYSITFPFTVEPKGPEMRDLAEIKGKQIVYNKPLQGADRVMTVIGGFSDRASDYDFRIESQAAGAGMRVTGDRPLSRSMLWSIRSVVSVEPYIDIAIKPGEEYTWNLTYNFYTLGKN
ncbi:MAG: hypothetical protein QOJ99_737 [Bryobacterales bacterium]|nr:hypothetical protein [Bryobacterales bacterium]